MQTRLSFVVTLVVGLAPSFLVAADALNFTGEFADKHFLKDQGVFQLSLEQTGNDVSVFFSAAHNDGRGAAPEAEGTGKVTSKGTVEFKWEDSFKNLGTGTIKRADKDVIVSLKTLKVADSRCLQFYGENMRLKPAGKK